MSMKYTPLTLHTLENAAVFFFILFLSLNVVQSSSDVGYPSGVVEFVQNWHSIPVGGLEGEKNQVSYHLNGRQARAFGTFRVWCARGPQ